MSIFLPQLDSDNPLFPSIFSALEEPNGLLAWGGNLSIDTLIDAYPKGIFPWFSDGEPILWWSPDPRMVLFPQEVHISKSMKRLMKRHRYQMTVNQNFSNVIAQCRLVREKTTGTWINNQMLLSYNQLYQSGYAHSIEVWDEGNLVGGLYGIAIDQIFFGESMFSLQKNTSKLALIFLCELGLQQGIKMIDCQVANSHLASMGGRNISREQFFDYLKQYCINKNTVKIRI